MKYLVLLALAIAAISTGLFVHDQVEESRTALQHFKDGIAAVQAQADAANLTLVRQNDALEREIERINWSSPAQLREQKGLLATRIEADLKNLQEREKYGVSDESVRIAIAMEEASVERLDKRLGALVRSNQAASQRCATCRAALAANGSGR